MGYNTEISNIEDLDIVFIQPFKLKINLRNKFDGKFAIRKNYNHFQINYH